jgi:hypothetical protein
MTSTIDITERLLETYILPPAIERDFRMWFVLGLYIERRGNSWTTWEVG